MELFFAVTSTVPDRSFVFTLTVIIAGLGTVLLTLALLILIFNIFGKFVSFFLKNAKQKKSAALSADDPDSAPKRNAVPLPPPIVETEGVPPEVVAAITAAVYSVEGEGAKITSISRKRPQRRGVNPWAQAATAENTKPF